MIISVGAIVKVVDQNSPLFGGEYEVIETGADNKVKVLAGGEFVWLTNGRYSTVQGVSDKPVVLVDLDGTLAVYGGWKGFEHIGDPIPEIVGLIRRIIKAGNEVRIFTARAENPEAIPYVKTWVKKHIGEDLVVTNVKGMSCTVLIDDRAMRVKEGEICLMCLLEKGKDLGI